MPHRFSAIIASLALALTLGVTACSAPSAGTPDTSTSTVVATSTASPEDTVTISGSMVGSNPDVAALITVSDVERITGLTGLKSIDKGANSNALGRVNIATAEGTLILTVNIGDRYAFDDSKAGMNYGSEITGVGEEGYVGPSAKVSKTPSIVAARTADHAIILHTFEKTASRGRATELTIEQLQQLAKLILARWQ